MKFSAWPSVTNPWAELLPECHAIEKAGWQGIWIGDHFMANAADNSGPWQESWSIISALAAAVPRLRLGTLVTGNTYRHPTVLAKQVAQADVISGGRVVLGIGAGWQENEHTAYGIPFFTTGERLRRLEESVQVIRSLFTNERTNFDGLFYQLKDAPLAPKPLQRQLPILIGGGGEKVTLRIVARHADEWNVPGSPETFAAKSRLLDEHCQREGRNPKAIKRVAAVQVSPGSEAGLGQQGPFVTYAKLADLAGVVERYAEAGAEELIVHYNPRRPLPERQEFWASFQQDLAPAFA